MENEHEPARTPPAVSSPSPETPPTEAEPAPATPEAPARSILRPRETGPGFYAILAVLLFVVSYSIAFVVGNNRTIHVDFVFATADVSLIWTILLLLVVGLAGGLLLSQLYRHQRRQQRGKP